MSSSKPSSKNVLVSFTSDSEDEGNTSTSSARGSSREGGLSSEDEVNRAAKNNVATDKSKAAGKLKKSDLDDLPVLQSNKAKNGPTSASDKSEDLPILNSSVDSGVLSKTKKTSKVSDVDSEQQKLADNEDYKITKSKKKSSPVEDAQTIKSDTVDPEERNLAPPTKSKIKSRSKSPKDEKLESVVDEAVNKVEPVVEQFVDDSAEKPLKTKKKKKQTSEERDEFEGTTFIEKTPDATEVKAASDVSVKKKKSKDIEENLLAPSEVTLATVDDSTSGKVHKKKSSKSGEVISVNGEKDLEIPQATITPESPSLRRKKKKELADMDQDRSSSEKRLSTEINGMAATDVTLEEKPKKKKSSKTLVDTESMLNKPAEEGVAVKVISVDPAGSASDIGIQMYEASPSQRKSEKPLEAAVQEEKVDAVVVNEVQDLPSNNITIVKPVSEESVGSRTILGASGLDLGAAPFIDVSSIGLTNSEPVGKSAIENLSAEEAVEEEQRQARKKAADELNDEVAKFLEKLPTITRPTRTEDSGDGFKTETVESAKRTATQPPAAAAEDDTSEFSQRRQSMDDFIKKILAEAREERQRLKGNLEADATLLGKVAAGEPLTSPLTSEVKDIKDKEGSMLERRLASVEKKRLKESDDGKPLLGKLNTNGAEEEEDEISRIIRTRRAQRKAMEEGVDFDDAESIPSEAGSMRPRARRARDDFDDDESFASSKPPLMPGGRARGGRDDGSEKGESFVSKWRRERESSQLPEDSFAPRRSDQTDEVVRERTRHIRIIVDQQADIAKTMRATSRSMDELDNEIREVRQMALDWQARIESLEQAIDSEYRQYEADQQAANERLRQQRVPDDRALREELRGIGRNRRLRGESMEDEGFVPGSSRRRSGSVASTTSIASSYMGRGGGGGGMDSGLELDYYLGAGGTTAGRRSDARRADSETDFSIDRVRRAGSLSRNLSDLLGDNDDLLGPRSRGNSTRPGADSATPSVSDEVMRIRAKYSTLNNGPSAAPSYSPSSRLSAGTDFGGGYTSGYTSRRDQPLYSSRYGDPTSSSSLLSSTSRYSSGLGTIGDYSSPSSGLESSRIRRAMSVSEMNYDRPTSSFRGSSGLSSYGEPGTDFRSKFLSSKDYSTGSSSAAGSSRSKDKPFKSRFLKSSSALSDSTPSRFSSSSVGGVSGGEGSTSAPAQE